MKSSKVGSFIDEVSRRTLTLDVLKLVTLIAFTLRMQRRTLTLDVLKYIDNAPLGA